MHLRVQYNGIIDVPLTRNETYAGHCRKLSKRRRAASCHRRCSSFGALLHGQSEFSSSWCFLLTSGWMLATAELGFCRRALIGRHVPLGHLVKTCKLKDKDSSQALRIW